MSESALPIGRAAAHRIHGVGLDAALVMVVMASQWGMLLLEYHYLNEGRVQTLSPEAVMGAAALFCALIVAKVGRFSFAGDRVGMALAAFLAYAAVGEVLRPDPRYGNISTLLSIFAYYVLGRAIGRRAMGAGGTISVLPFLLVVYLGWYVGMLAFYINGDLGFFNILEESSLNRLEFRQGFVATEIPIYVGLQLPVILYAVMVGRTLPERVFAAVLLSFALLFVVASVSAAALMAVVIVYLTLHVARWGGNLKSAASLAGIGLLLVIVVDLAGGGIVDSAVAKLSNIALGEGERALIYTELIAVMAEHPMGIGMSRFVEVNTLSWLGEGVYPHQNLLGIGAELGVLALILFLVFLYTAIATIGKGAWSRTSPLSREVRVLAAVGLAVFLFQMFRGMFQDTWTIRETYLWLGIGVGVVSYGVRSEVEVDYSQAQGAAV